MALGALLVLTAAFACKAAAFIASIVVARFSTDMPAAGAIAEELLARGSSCPGGEMEEGERTGGGGGMGDGNGAGGGGGSGVCACCVCGGGGGSDSEALETVR